MTFNLYIIISEYEITMCEILKHKISVGCRVVN